MADLQMGPIESRFADIIWQNEPLSSAELAKRSAEELQWKKTTSFTVLKRLCDKGIFQNTKGTVTSRISRRDFYALQSEKFVEETFDGAPCRPFWPRSRPQCPHAGRGRPAAPSGGGV